MTKVIILSDETLDRFYERIQQDLHDKFHTCPSNLAGSSLSGAEKAQICYYQAMAWESARKSSRSLHLDQDWHEPGRSGNSRGPGGKPWGKIVC